MKYNRLKYNRQKFCDCSNKEKLRIVKEELQWDDQVEIEL